ncbi:aminotransferase class I/II-fold pyridoxal phosphate-dependent enzyme, partial [Streptomyces sp. MUM 203J]|uniref:aminotransferase class I/II-fold pyridoxal phosphate-dependent enzyme n=1 Tax=Streptomyces sp. MUM 203J TaxID=2791990 RepID=UPI001F04FE59
PPASPAPAVPAPPAFAAAAPRSATSPGAPVPAVADAAGAAPDGPVPDDEAQLLLLSARDRAGLARYAREVARVLSDDRPPLSRTADTLARRTSFPERLAVVAEDTADAAARLATAAEALDAGRTGVLGPGLAAGSAEAGEQPEAELPAPGSLSAGARTAELARLAELVVAGACLRPVKERIPPCTLPPSPLAPRHHWAVDESKRETVPEAVADAVPAADEPLMPAAPPAGPVASVASVVLEEVSRVGVFPVADLKERMVLVDDLGFDSLMLEDLEVGLRRRVPGLRTEEVFEPGLTIGRLTELADTRADGPLVPVPPPPREVRSDWGADTARVDDFPEVRQFEERLDAVTGSGADFPYFRIHEGTIRDRTVIGDRAYLSFGSYNYLGLSGHPAVSEAAREAVDRYGTSVSASRVLSGERDLTVRLERALASFLGVEDCLALVSGHATNVTAIGHLVGKGDLVVHDALAHDSILQGCALSGAARRPFAHNDTGQLEHLLRLNRGRFRRVLIAVEGAYSMDGDLVDLPAVIGLKKRYGALLMVDEAHSIGTVGETGRGVGEFFAADRTGVDLWMGTLSKAFASCGGYLGGSARMVRWLRHTLPGFVYSVGLTPANAAAALAATELITAQPHRVRALRRNARLFLDLATAAGLATGSSAHTPIVPCLLGSSARTLRVADRLYEQGVIADPIFHPAVEEGLARLRFFVTSEHREDDIRRAVSVLAQEAADAAG